MRLSVSGPTRFLLSLLFATPLLAATLQPTGSSVAGEVLVKIKPGASQAEVSSIHSMADADQSKRIATLKSGALWRLHSRSKNAEALTKALEKNPNVEYAEPNYIVRFGATPNDSSYPTLWGLKNTGQTVGSVAGTPGSDIKAEAAWNVTTGSASIVVGVVDTGIDYNHADLAANIWSNPGGKGNAACAAGTHGFNAITGTCDPMDDHYHGTHVAGTIGAVGNNGAGVTGVNWTTSIMGLKFLNSSGYGTTSDAIEAIEFAVQAKIDGVNVRVLSNSWGGGAFSRALLDEINRANEHDILFVAAAGNSTLNNDTYPNYPSNYNTANMIAVAALDNRDLLAGFSNYGATSVHLGAPGVGIYSTIRNNTYSSLSGTSMATPHVAGVAALVLAQTPSLTTAQVKSAILNNTDPVASLTGKSTTGGRLNAARALGLPPDPAFTLSVSPASRAIAQGASTTYTVTVTPIGGFSGSVDLSITGLPSNTTGIFSPNPATTTSTLTITTSSSTPTGNSPLTITGVSGALTRIAFASLTTTTTPPVYSCPSYFPSYHYVGTGQTAAVTGDFNRDGSLDLATAQVSANRITISPGPFNAFSSYYIYATGGIAPAAIAAGDLNGDGRTDLVTANSSSNNVSVLLASGDFAFQSPVLYAAGSTPFSVAIGDFNADGKSDLAVANNGSSNVSILLGQGDGTFQPAVHYNSGSSTFYVTATDFDLDGKSDLAVANFNTNKISILAGNGDGTFGSPVEYAPGTGPSAIAAGDLNGDGKPDLAVANYKSNNVSVLLGNGDRTFEAAVHYAAGAAPSSVTIGDLNDDNHPDLATANSESNNASILFGAGNGTFLTSSNIATDYEPSHVLTADFNRDGKTELAVTHEGDYYFYVLYNVGTCSLNCGTMAPVADHAAGTTPDSLTAGDFNRDGRIDLAVANQGSNNVSMLLGNGNGTFSAGTTVGAGTSPDGIAAGDFDRDGKLDLAVANNGSNNVSIARSNGDGTFQAAVPYNAGTNPRSVAAGDFNRDGKPDLAVANGGSANISVLLGNGDTTFQTAVDYAAGTTPVSVAIGDLNRDGRADLAVANSGSDNVSILYGNGNGTFQAATNLVVGTNPSAIAIGDFNRDGRSDLAASNSGSNNVSVLLANTSGGFQNVIHYPAGTSPAGITIDDFNDDAVPDLAIVNGGSNNLSILAGAGNGQFLGAVNSASGTTPAAIVAGDFNRDGKPDLATANSGAATVSILLNTCPLADLTITKTHTGSFTQGDTGKTFTITVTNSGAMSSSGVVTVTDALPAGLSATTVSGTGWTCTLATLTCTRNDALAAGASYPAITLTVKVSSSAPASVTNNVIVAGGGEVNTANSTAADSVSIAAITDFVITSSHAGSFVQGATGRTYTLLARNAGGAASSGTVTVTDVLPAGLTATAISGTGWSCTLGTLSCTRSDSLAGTTSYPPITVTVNVAANAAANVTNVATIAGGGDANGSNNTASDPTIIWASQTCGSFGAPAYYDVGYYTSSLAVADFNSDSKVDVAVANHTQNKVTIFQGNGNGTLTLGGTFVTGTYPVDLATGDLNNDGKADLVVANYYANTISVLIGNGDGTFAAAVSYSSASYPKALVLADLDRDGTLDVGVAGEGTLSVSILLGTGDGTLRSQVKYAAGYYAGDIAAADFNGDTNLDLVVPEHYGNGGMILTGNGDGSFAAAFAYTGGSSARAVVTADFNADGKMDFAVTSFYGVAVLLGNGNATFQTPVTYDTYYSPSSLAVEDLNVDGKTDIVAGTYYAVSLLYGNGNGTFQPQATIPVNEGLFRVTVTDFNADGRADLGGVTEYGGKVAVLMNACADLTITKTHNGQLITGSTVHYKIRVSNSGGASVGTVTVTDALPSGLTATFLYGYGWTCTLATLTCTRSDSLAGGSYYYDDITLSATVNASAQQTITNVATVSGGGDSNNSNNSASDSGTVIQVPDLTILNVHSGTSNLAQGETGRTYTLTVTNVGGAPTSGTIAVSNTLPSGLAPTAISGTGWSCMLAQLTCTRSDTLNSGASYPPITLTVNVDLNAPAYIETIALVSASGESNTSNNSDSDFAYVIQTPFNVTATAASSTLINISWAPSPNATRYQVYRSSNNGPFGLLAEIPGVGLSDATVSPNTTYVYRVRAGDNQILGPLSHSDIATTVIFTDNPITPRWTMMKALHITELRTAVNAVRAAAGLAPASSSDAITAGSMIRASHQSELRTALNEARIALGIGALGYTDPALAAGSLIRAAHINELRLGVR